MKGFFKVLGEYYAVHDASGKKISDTHSAADDATLGSNASLYRPAADILSFEKHKTLEEVQCGRMLCNYSAQEGHRMIHKLLPREYITTDVNCDPSGFHCTCFALAFPIYEVSFSLRRKDGRTVSYFLHPKEREHMERCKAGTDDAFHDLAHLLRYMPGGIDVMAVESAQSELKKRKI